MVKRDIVDKAELVISFLLKLAILNIFIIDLVNGYWVGAFVAFVVFVFSLVPSLVERNYKIYLPNEFGFFTTLLLYLHYVLGEIKGYYEIYPWYDNLLHYSGSLLIGLVGFFIVYTFYYTKEVKTSPFFVVLFTFIFSLAIGTLWEIVEYSIDVFFAADMQKGLVNTMSDLLMDTLGALLASLLGYLYIKRAKGILFDRIIRRFTHLNKN